MALSRAKLVGTVCLRTRKTPGEKKKCRWALWMFPLAGLLALIWFLIRVVPKPARAAYPCQRVAMPLASGFVVWLAGLVSSALAYRKGKELFRQSRVALACACLAVAAVMGVVTLVTMPETPVMADPPNPNNPMGVAKGVNPGRVVWVHDPDATDWDGYGQGDGHWWESDNTDQAVVDQMMYRAVRSLAGEAGDAEAWDAIFRHFNQTHGKGDVGYAPGEKIMIKVNFVGCINFYNWGGVNPNTYDLEPNRPPGVDKMDYMNTSPQLMLALLRQLVYVVGVNEADISIGDTICLFPNQYYDVLHDEFQSVQYLDNAGGNAEHPRTAMEYSTVPLYWSTGGWTEEDYIPTCFTEASYVINMANLKSHESNAGITLCAKNDYGSLLRSPYVTSGGKYDLHGDLCGGAGGNPSTGSYRTLVDLMGHAHLGGKTLLYLIDGLYGGRHTMDEHPIKWNSAPFGGDWPSSLFVSQDPVAIDSVGFDFLWTEWTSGPHWSAADDYLTEAALADNPPSGTFYDPDHEGDVERLPSLGVHEHWNNATDKQYSRNLGTGDGIELVQCLDSQTTIETLDVKPAGAITIDGDPNDWSLPEFTTYSRGGEKEIGDIGQVGWLDGTFYCGQYCVDPGYTLPDDAADHTVRFYSRHDTTYQYFLVRCDDDDLQYPYAVGENWRNDCAEFFIDPGHQASTINMQSHETTSEFELVIDASNRQNVYETTSAYRLQILSGVTSAVSVDATGWWLEVRIDKSVTNPALPAGGTFGINVNLHDLDGSDQALYGWADDHYGGVGFPDKIPANWGDAYNPYGGFADCNGNGIPDECDIDCSAGDPPGQCGIDYPDDCGLSQDCQPNGIPDECDIAGGPSEDCDENDVPDECQTDTDEDGVIDPCDNCPDDYNPDQADNDGDEQGDVCDEDDDNDTVPDAIDNCPWDPNSGQEDNDQDGVGDACDDCPGTMPGVVVDERGCPLPVPGDFDGDSDVDQQDFGHLQSCFSGSGTPPSDPSCENADLDHDEDVDQSDFGVFQACVSGPNVPGQPDCDQ